MQHEEATKPGISMTAGVYAWDILVAQEAESGKEVGLAYKT